MDNRYITVKELSELLNIPVKTLYSYTHKRIIPFLKIHGHLRFNFLKILQQFEFNSQTTHLSVKIENSKNSLKIEKEMKKRRDLHERRLK